jgi:hypothetical protein
MRMFIVLPIAAALIAAVIGSSSPAAATTLKEALALCNKTGNCMVHGRPGVGVNIAYKRNEIFCPYGGGQCQCLLCSAPKPAAAGPNDDVSSVLSQNTTGGAPTPKDPVVGGSTGTKVGAPPVVKPASQR